MTILILVRHAVTQATGDRLGGWTPGVHLSEEGRAQAGATAGRLAGLPVAAVVTSPLDRTQDTAGILAAPHGLEPRVHDGLGEVDYGDWTDEPLDELREQDLWRVVQQAPSRVTFPSGGTIRGAQARAVDALETIAGEHSGEVVVAVSHADVIKAVVAHFVGMPLDSFQRLVVSPASASVLALPEGGAARLLRFNDSGPLELPDTTDAGDDGGEGTQGTEDPPTGDGRGRDDHAADDGARR